jgi:diguanylate cyclase (GGDEF)-like protein
MEKSIKEKVLVVEANKFISNYICRDIETDGFETLQAFTYEQAKSIFNRGEPFFAAVMGLVLPDALDGEVVDLAIDKNIPSIVLTGSFDEKTRKKIAGKCILDYIVKQDMDSFKSVRQLINRIYLNRDIKVLIVDDSRSVRSQYKFLLRSHLYNVIEAEDGRQALDILQTHPDIRLVLTDYNMPNMDGFEFVHQARKCVSKNQTAIIGISSLQDRILSAKFLKLGANDFLSSPFLTEEFYARITQNIEMVEMFETLKDAAIRDPLTRLFNRRYFFETGQGIFKKSKETGTVLAAAMIDIDYFKKINDRYGHDTGDVALKCVSDVLSENMGKNHILARLGGEEFCVLAPGADEADADSFFDGIRKKIEASEINYKDNSIKVTVSMGISHNFHNSLEEMLNHADEMLYQAKRNGRNQVISAAA